MTTVQRGLINRRRWQARNAKAYQIAGFDGCAVMRSRFPWLSEAVDY